jgi:hypothetical protein
MQREARAAHNKKATAGIARRPIGVSKLGIEVKSVKANG